MNRETQELLEQLQKFTNEAVKHLQKGNNDRASFFFSLAASISGKLSETVK